MTASRWKAAGIDRLWWSSSLQRLPRLQRELAQRLLCRCPLPRWPKLVMMTLAPACDADTAECSESSTSFLALLPSSLRQSKERSPSWAFCSPAPTCVSTEFGPAACNGALLFTAVKYLALCVLERKSPGGFFANPVLQRVPEDLRNKQKITSIEVSIKPK